MQVRICAIMSGMPQIDFTKLDGEHLLTTLQEEAVKNGVSDLHLSPQKNDVRLEWRLHGILLTLASVSHVTYVDLLRRVKFLSKLKLNITNVPQDGQYTFPSAERMVNVRVATLPSRFGEAITLRLLDPDRGILPLQQLGFPPEIEKTLKELVEIPNGLVDRKSVV